MSMNTLTPEGKEKYKSKFFTEKGYETLLTFTKSLIKESFKHKDGGYPFKLGVVFGIPMFDWAQEFKTHDEMMGRIKAYMQILGVEELIVDDIKFSFKLKEDKK